MNSLNFNAPEQPERSKSTAPGLLRGALLLTSAMLLTGLGYACANPNQPPGGPPDAAPPRVVKITPSSGTIGARPKAVVFQFDEVISETPKGQTDLAKLVFVSPKSGDIEVDWRRSQLDVKPAKGWKPNTVYTVLLGAGVTDLRNNSIDSAVRIVFSTGGPIPETKVDGVVFDWQLNTYAREALIEAIVRDTAKKDSIIFQTIADSLGRYSLQHIPPGNYVLRAILDRNNNRSLERLEAWDTVGITVTSTSNVELHAFTHDSIGLGITSVTLLDSNKTLRVTFDKPVLPAQAFSTTNFTLRRNEKTDSTTILNILTVFSGPQRALFDSLRNKAREDSIARTRPVDTTAAGRAARDSVARQKVRDSLRVAELQRNEERRLLALRGGRALPPKDTTPKPKMKRAPLYTEVYLTLDRPLDYGARYQLIARNVTSVSGVRLDTTRVRARYTINVPQKPKEPDAKKAPGDTTEATPVPIKR